MVSEVEVLAAPLISQWYLTVAGPSVMMLPSRSAFKVSAQFTKLGTRIDTFVWITLPCGATLAVGVGVAVGVEVVGIPVVVGVGVALGVSVGGITVVVGVYVAVGMGVVGTAVVVGVYVAMGVGVGVGGTLPVFMMRGWPQKARSPVAGPVARSVRMNLTFLPDSALRFRSSW